MGFRLEPLTNATTGNPVSMSITVRVNQNSAQVFTLTDDAPQPFAEGFSMLEVMSGNAGDRWRLTIYTTHEDLPGAPARVLPQSIIIAEKTSFTAAEWAGGVFYLLGASGASQQAVSSTPPPAFDVSRFRALHLYAGALVSPDPAVPASNPGLTASLHVLMGGTPPDAYDIPGGVQLNITNTQQGMVIASETQASTVDALDSVAQFTVLPFRPVWARVAFNFYEASGANAPGRVVRPGTYIRLVGLL